MKISEYRTIFNLEADYWWYRGLRELVNFFVKMEEGYVTKSVNLLDAGCGTGLLLKNLAGQAKAYGIDVSDTALGFCQKRGLRKIAKASVCSLPFPDQFFDVIISNDVLCHQEVKNDSVALSEFHRVLKNGGTLILHLPAFNFLKRPHDKAVHTRERYDKKNLSKIIKNCGFEPIKVSYRNIFLFPAALMLTLFKNRDESDLRTLPRIMNAALLGLSRMENLLINTKIILPL